MEGLANLVTESLVRHGFQTTVDHRRLEWSLWFPCQDRLSLLLVPFKPGLFALSEEVASERSRGQAECGSEKRMLALFHIAEADDLGMALGRLMLAGNPLRERLNSGRCFARYVVIEDAPQRHGALAALQRWVTSSAEAISTTPPAVETLLATSLSRGAELRSESSNKQAQIGSPTPIPSGF